MRCHTQNRPMLSTGLALIPFVKFRAWLELSLTKADHVDISEDLGALGFTNYLSFLCIWIVQYTFRAVSTQYRVSQVS